jgi:hypothetical protein
MPRTPEEQARKQQIERIEEQLMELLQQQDELKPKWCQQHDQLPGECEEEELGCDESDFITVGGAVLVEYALATSYMLPNGDRVMGTWTSPRLPYTHALGLLTAAADEL